MGTLTIKWCNHQLAKNIDTVLPGLSQGLCDKEQAEQAGRTGATYWCESSRVNKEHQAFWLQREEKLLALHRGTVRKWYLMEKPNQKNPSKETQALLLDLLQIWWTDQQNSLGWPGCAHTHRASSFSLWTRYFTSSCSECCDPWVSGAVTKQHLFSEMRKEKKNHQWTV